MNARRVQDLVSLRAAVARDDGPAPARATLSAAWIPAPWLEARLTSLSTSWASPESRS